MFVLSRGMEFVFLAMDRSDDDDDDDDVEMLSTIAWFDRRRYCSFDEWGREGDTEKHDFYITWKQQSKEFEIFIYISFFRLDQIFCL